MKNTTKAPNNIVIGTCNIKGIEQNVYLNEDYDCAMTSSIMCAKQGSGRAYYVSSCKEFMNDSEQKIRFKRR